MCTKMLDQLDQDVLETLLSHLDPPDIGRVCMLNHTFVARLTRARLRAACRRLRWNEFRSPTARFSVAQVLQSASARWDVGVVESRKNQGEGWHRGWVYVGVCDEEIRYAWTVRVFDGLFLTFETNREHCRLRRTADCFTRLCNGMGNDPHPNIRFRLEGGFICFSMRESEWNILCRVPDIGRLRPFVYAPLGGVRFPICGFS